jgi:hypothetical protein
MGAGKNRFCAADISAEMQEKEMYQLCIKIGGQMRCIDVPMLVDLNLIHRPPPNNIPQVELAATVIGLVETVEASRKSELGEKLVEVSKAYIQSVQAGLPQGVEITETRGPAKHA